MVPWEKLKKLNLPKGLRYQYKKRTIRIAIALGKKKVLKQFFRLEFSKRLTLRWKAEGLRYVTLNVEKAEKADWQKSYSFVSFEFGTGQWGPGFKCFANSRKLVPWHAKNLGCLKGLGTNIKKSKNAWQKSFGKFDWKQVALKAYVTLKERQVWTCLKLLPEGLMLRNKNVC